MKIEQLIPLPINKVQFKFSSFKLVPKVAGCYVLTTFGGEIIYIGLSGNIFDRFQQHLANPEKTNPTEEGKVVWFYYTNYDQNNLARLERTWINQFAAIHGRLPILNKVNSPIS
jgi:excinuclease UvrABC nuclease subunit